VGGADTRPTGHARPILPKRAAWPSWLMATLAALVGLTRTGRRVLLGHGRTVGGRIRTQHVMTVLVVGVVFGVTSVRAQDASPAPPHPLQVVQEFLALSYPELRGSALVAREVSTAEGVVIEFAERGPADADLVARTAPRPARLTATVTVDADGHLRHLVCRGAWTGLERSRAVIGTAREGVAARLFAAQARFGGVQDEAVKSEARRLLDRHGVAGVRMETAALEEAGGTMLWVTQGATARGESVVMHLEPLTGKLIAFHVGGDR